MINLVILIITLILGFLLIKKEFFDAGKIINDPLDIDEEGSINIKNQLVNNKFICKKLYFSKSNKNDEEFIDYTRAKFLKNVPLLFKEKVCLGKTCLVEKDLKNLKTFFPQGTIIPWVPDNYTTLTELTAPKGWMLCDGSKSPDGKMKAPNLTNSFVMGKNINDEKKGGSNTFKLETKHLPPHSHGIKIAAPGTNCFGPLPTVSPSGGGSKPNDGTNCSADSPYEQKSKIKRYIPPAEKGATKYPKLYNLSYLYNNTKGKGDMYPLESSAEGGVDLKDSSSEQKIKCDTGTMDNTPKNVTLVYIMKVDQIKK